MCMIRERWGGQPHWHRPPRQTLRPPLRASHGHRETTTTKKEQPEGATAVLTGLAEGHRAFVRPTWVCRNNRTPCLNGPGMQATCVAHQHLVNSVVVCAPLAMAGKPTLKAKGVPRAEGGGPAAVVQHHDTVPPANTHTHTHTHTHTPPGIEVINTQWRGATGVGRNHRSQQRASNKGNTSCSLVAGVKGSRMGRRHRFNRSGCEG